MPSERNLHLAILLLVYHHNWYDTSLLSPLRTGTRIIVWIFLFITAYGYSSQLDTTQNKHPVKFVIKRLALIYVPFWICGIVNLAVYLCVDPGMVVSFYFGLPINWLLDIFSVSQYFGTPCLLGGWYINMLVLIIMAFPLIHFVVSKLKWFSILLVLALTWFLPWKIYYEYGGYLDEYLLIVVLGILFYKYRCFKYLPKINSNLRLPLIAITVLVFIAALCFRYEYIQYVSNTIILRFDPLSTLMALAVISAIYMFRRDGKFSSVFEKLGSYSADIFYIHSIFYNAVFPVLGINNPILTFVLCFSVSLLISMGIEFIKGKTGFNQKLRIGIDRMLNISPAK